MTQQQPSQIQLEAWIEETVASVRDRTVDFEVLEAHHDEFLITFGLLARTLRFADAYLTLARANFESEAVVLARAALEHAVSAEWIFVTNGGINRFRVQIAHDRINHYTNLAEWLDNDELREAVKELDTPPDGKQLPPFTAMLRDVDDGKFLETSYHILSQQVHVTHAAVTSFLDAKDQARPIELKYEQEYPYGYQAVYVVAAACMLVRWIIARLTNDTDLLSVLDKASDDLILPMNLVDNLPAGKRRRGL